MATYRDSHRSTVDTDGGAFYKAATVLLGLAVGVVGMVALLLWADTRQDRETAGATATAA